MWCWYAVYIEADDYFDRQGWVKRFQISSFWFLHLGIGITPYTPIFSVRQTVHTPCACNKCMGECIFQP